MPNEIEQPAMGSEIQPATGNQPQGNQQGATPKFDSAARIAELEGLYESSKSHIGSLNTESKNHRLAKEQAEAQLQTERTKFEGERAKLADILKHGTPEEILATIEERNTLKSAKEEKEAAEARDTILKDVSRDAEVSFDVLKNLDNAGLAYEIKEEKKGNVTQKVVTVNGKPFDEHFALFLPSLRPAAPFKPGAKPTPTPTNTQPVTPQVPRVGFL
jgi:hypothetical protein